jgi:Cd2+/Zn2+-exporting ATPase
MTETLQLDLDVVLPHAHGANDRCVADLIDALGRLDGVESVHVTTNGRDEAPIVATGALGSAQVCLHLTPGSVSTTSLTRLVRAAGADLDERYGHLVIKVDGVGNSSRATALTRRVRSIDGVVDAVVTIEGVARIEFDRTRTDRAGIDAALARLGLRHRPDSRRPRRHASDRHLHDEVHGDDHAHGGSRVELTAAVVSLAVYLVGRGLDWFTDLDTPVTGLYVMAAAVTGLFVARDAWLSVRARVFDIDQLMLIAAVGAAAIGHWSDAALLLVLFSLGHALEGYAMSRARSAIESLGELAPATARRKADPTVEVPVEELAVGDVVVVKPHERVPADGVIVAGETSIDQSAVTGESIPVDKVSAPEWLEPYDGNGVKAVVIADGMDDIDERHRAYAGTLNGAGAIELMVARTAADSTLARVVQMVAEAETQISPTQRLTKRIVRVFVPVVLVLVAGLIVVPPLLGEAFTDSFARAMAVLVAASPCALAIATPSAVLAAIARAARAGVLVKGGGPLEALGSVTSIAFDKTGTLTEGHPVLTEVEAATPEFEDRLLAVSLAVERSSAHPIARALVAGLESRLADRHLPAAHEVTAVNGKGVTAVVDGEPVMIGNPALFEGIDVPPTLLTAKVAMEQRGRTTIMVRHGHCFLGLLGVMDTPRDHARATVDALRSMGVDSVVMLSGDTQRVATAVGRIVGIADARGDLLPDDKVAAVRALGAGGVAMIGDGVNDAPALAAADVGIAMGAAGNDVALDTADIALMADRIEDLPFTVGLARRAGRTITQNLFFSLAVVAVLIPLTILGVGISLAVIVHEGSTLVVVTNALRLLNHDRRSVLRP